MEVGIKEYGLQRLLREGADGFTCLRLIGGAAARNCVGQFDGLGEEDRLALARALVARRFERAEPGSRDWDLLERYNRSLRSELLFNRDAFDGREELPVKVRIRLFEELLKERISVSPVRWVRAGSCFEGSVVGDMGSGMAFVDLGSRRYAIDYSITYHPALAPSVENASLLSLIGVSSGTHAHCATIEHLREVARVFLFEIDDLLLFILNRAA